MINYDPVAFGESLRTHRLKLGWSGNQLSQLYAECVGREDSPPNPAFIYHIERGVTMVSQKRRAILASLVGMPLAGGMENSTVRRLLIFLSIHKRSGCIVTKGVKDSSNKKEGP